MVKLCPIMHNNRSLNFHSVGHFIRELFIEHFRTQIPSSLLRVLTQLHALDRHALQITHGAWTLENHCCRMLDIIPMSVLAILQ